MSVQLDWQQDLEEEGWPQRQESGPPAGKGSRLSRYILIGAVVLLVAGAAVVWVMNQRGERALRADVQEAAAHIHWTLQQNDPNLFVEALDNTSARWIELGRSEWPRLAAAALEAPAPTVETVSMNDNIAAAAVRWTDATVGHTYRARRWYRLDGANWRWTQPRPSGDADFDREQSAHVTLEFQREDGEIAPLVLPLLDDLIANRCQEFGVSDERCHFYLRWDVVDGDGLPLTWQDMPLPPLGSTQADKMDPPVFLANGREADWRSASLRRRLQGFYQGRVYVAQSSLTPLRPADDSRLPTSLPGDPSTPLVLPSPALEGIDENGQPHPRWLAHADRVLTDLVLRKAEGYVLGLANTINAAWALHQALLAMATDLPVAGQLPSEENVSPPSDAPLELPDLDSLGAALQRNPDDVALRQLAGLVRFLQSRWPAQQLTGLLHSMGSAGTVDQLLQGALAISSQDFDAAWRQQEMAEAGSVMSGLTTHLEEMARQEAEAWQDNRESASAAMGFYTERGRIWRSRRLPTDALFGNVGYGDQWQIEVNAVGAIGPAIWVELTESDGTLAARDLRFYVKDPAAGWLRDQPAREFWGNPRSQVGELARWNYFEVDEEAVAAVIPLFDAAYRQAAADFGFEATPITITVDADVELPLESTRPWNEIVASSPRSYVLLNADDDATGALRRAILVRMVLNLWMRRASQMEGDLISDRAPGLLVLGSAALAELEQLYLPTERLLVDFEPEALAALANGQLPEISEISVQPGQPGSLALRVQPLLVMYLFQRHGFGLLDSTLNAGLAATLEQVMEEQGWTQAELEADWREYLAARGGG